MPGSPSQFRCDPRFPTPQWHLKSASTPLVYGTHFVSLFCAASIGLVWRGISSVQLTISAPRNSLFRFCCLVCMSRYFLTHSCTQRIWCSITASLLASVVSAITEPCGDSLDQNSFIALSFSVVIIFF